MEDTGRSGIRSRGRSALCLITVHDAFFGGEITGRHRDRRTEARRKVTLRVNKFGLLYNIGALAQPPDVA